MTRAKRHVCVICNVDCVSTDPVLKSFTDYLTSHADVRTATQYEHLRVDVVRPQGMEFTLQDSAAKKATSKKSAKIGDKKSAKNVGEKSTVKTGSNPETMKRESKTTTEDKIDSPERREELRKMVRNFVDSESDEVFK